MKPSALLLVAAAHAVSALSIAEINGNHFRSPYDGQNVKNVTGLVTAVASNGAYLRSLEPDADPATSESVFVFASNLKIKVGDVVSVDAKVDKYRSNKNYIYMTELTKPTNIVVRSSGNKVVPLVIGTDTLSPPTEEYSSLDEGGIFGVPNAVNLVSEADPQLDVAKYGLDFWQSLLGELVTVKNVFLTSRPNNFGDVWVRGDWKVTGINGHGGVTMLDGDANPEAIIIGSPIDGSKNPTDARMGDAAGDITGVVYYAFGFYRILPLTQLTLTANASTEYPAVSFKSDGNCRGVTVADYNAENLAPDSAHLPKVIDQIVHKLLTPDLIFLQEVQDNSGPTNDGTTSANVTLSTLTKGIEAASNVTYGFVEIAPVNNQDGGQPGGNIRQAYLYRTDALKLHNPNQGGSLDDNEVVAGAKGPELKYNPGRIDPTNAAFDNSRKPLAAMWTPIKGTGKPFFTVNVHMGSKGGSSTLHSDQRPPINKGVEKRAAQNEATAVSAI